MYQILYIHYKYIINKIIASNLIVENHKKHISFFHVCFGFAETKFSEIMKDSSNPKFTKFLYGY